MAKHPVAGLKAEAFGPFEAINVEFSRSLNVVLGDNSTGKSQLLKLLYAATRSLRENPGATKRELQPAIADKLVGTFRPDSLGRLSRRVQGTARSSVRLKLEGVGTPLEFSFSSRSRTEVELAKHPTEALEEDQPVFMPSHELLSLGADFVSLYDTYQTPFEETWRDTVQLLLLPALRGPRGRRANELLAPFSELLQGGTVSEGGGRLYLHQPGIGNLEAPLLAEGHRKLAMIVRLISSGALLESGYLFWDEPEANLNPSSQKAVAHALIHLARHGVQIFVATHSTFLLRELEMTLENERDIVPRFIGLQRSTDDGQPDAAARVTAASVAVMENLPFIAALEAEARQADDYLGM
ncbi:AAA family ATPase [Micrococcus sp. 2A]|uniref:AAA family ATPase n=1 Tax=Micrococcus sp. 2A TaxID=3142261 RepID=UPI0031BB14D7